MIDIYSEFNANEREKVIEVKKGQKIDWLTPFHGYESFIKVWIF
jgi:hypothetical protein